MPARQGPALGAAARRAAAEQALLRLKLSIRRSPLAAHVRACMRISSAAGGVRRTCGCPRSGLRRRCAGYCGAVLPRASASGAARAAHHGRGGGRQHTAAAAYPASRGRTRLEQRLPAAAAQELASRVWTGLASVSGALPGRPAAGATCITWGSGTRRRIRPRTLRDVRGVADTKSGMAQELAGWPALHKLRRSMSCGERARRAPRCATHAHERSNSCNAGSPHSSCAPGLGCQPHRERLGKVLGRMRLRVHSPR